MVRHHHHHEATEPCDCQTFSEGDSLYGYIDKDRIRCLNERHENSAKSIFKPVDESLDRVHFLESDVDKQLLLFIPFTANVVLRGITLVGGEDEMAPRRMKVFINKEDIDFGNVDQLSPVQEWELQNENHEILYPTRVSKFSRVYHLVIYISDNYGDARTRLYYVKLTGDFKEARQEGVLNTVYESSPNPVDHKTKILDSFSMVQ